MPTKRPSPGRRSSRTASQPAWFSAVRISPTYDANPDVAKGGYIRVDASNGEPKVLLLATGSEVQLAVGAAEQLESEGIPARVVSLPCFEWFAEQDDAYRESVIPRQLRLASRLKPDLRRLGTA